MRNFLNSEVGAVSVDWVVVSAAVVGLGIASVGVLTSGMGMAGRTLSQNICDAVSDSDFPCQLTPFAFSVDGGWGFRAASEVASAAFSMDVELTANDNGVIWELGGAAEGIILYQHDGTIYLQAGDGSGIGTAANRGEASWTIDKFGQTRIEGVMDPQGGGVTLFINGEEVSSSGAFNGYIADTSQGGVGFSNFDVSANRGNFVQGQDNSHAGARNSSMTFYLNSVARSS